MKKTQTINLGKVIFTIDQDAYQKLDSYIRSLETHFSDKDDGGEIVADIEARIAEILNEKKVSIISVDDVVEIINIMGNPEQYDFEEDDSKNSSHKLNPSKEVVKRIYRHPTENVIAGVGAGLGIRFNVDPLIIRILFLLSTFLYGFGAILYLLMWIIIPKVKSTSDLLRMRGLPINSETISKIINEEKITNIKIMKKEAIWERVFSFFVNIVNFFIIFFFILGSVVLFITDFHYYYILFSSISLLSTIIFFALRKFFISKKELSLKKKILPLSLFIISTIVFFFLIPKNYFNHKEIIPLPQITTDSHGHILSNPNILSISKKEIAEKNNTEEANRVRNRKKDIMTKLNIKHSKDQKFYLIIHLKGSTRSPKPPSFDFSKPYLRKPYHLIGNRLILRTSVSSAMPEPLFSSLITELTLLVPENKSVYLDKSLTDILSYLETVDNVNSYQTIGHKWKMTDKGLIKQPSP